MKKMGCGRDWVQPAGCDGSVCIKWCQSDLCNKELIKHSPFRKELDEENSTEKGSRNWLDSLFGGSAMVMVSPGVLCLLLVCNIVISVLFL